VAVGGAGGVSVGSGVSVGVEVAVEVAVAVNVATRVLVAVGVGGADPAMRDPREQPRVPKIRMGAKKIIGRSLRLMI
jgi:hypothetical protein